MTGDGGIFDWGWGWGYGAYGGAGVGFFGGFGGRVFQGFRGLMFLGVWGVDICNRIPLWGVLSLSLPERGRLSSRSPLGDRPEAGRDRKDKGYYMGL